MELLTLDAYIGLMVFGYFVTGVAFFGSNLNVITETSTGPVHVFLLFLTWMTFWPVVLVWIYYELQDMD